MKFELDVKFVRDTKEFVAEGKVDGKPLINPGVARSANAAVLAAITDAENKQVVNLEGCGELLRTPGPKLDSVETQQMRDYSANIVGDFIYAASKENGKALIKERYCSPNPPSCLSVIQFTKK